MLDTVYAQVAESNSWSTFVRAAKFAISGQTSLVSLLKVGRCLHWLLVSKQFRIQLFADFSHMYMNRIIVYSPQIIEVRGQAN